jgi:hypothetical protein
MSSAVSLLNSIPISILTSLSAHLIFLDAVKTAFQIDSQEGMDNKLSRILVNQSQYIPKEVLV